MPLKKLRSNIIEEIFFHRIGLLATFVIVILSANIFNIIIFAGHESTPPGYYVDKVIVRVIADPFEAASQISERKLHVYLTPLNYYQYLELSKKYTDLGFIRVELGHIYILVNPEIKDYLAIKRILLEVINLSTVNQEVFNGLGRILKIPIPEENPLRSLFLDLIATMTNNIENSTKPFGFKNLSLVIVSLDDEILKSIASSIAFQLRTSGINITYITLNQLQDLLTHGWDFMIFKVGTWGSGDLLETILRVYSQEPIRSFLEKSEILRETFTCFNEIYELRYINFIEDLRACISKYIRSPLIALLTEPGFQIYDKSDLENIAFDHSRGLLSYIFFRTVMIKGYPYWGGTLVVGVAHSKDLAINPLILSGGLNDVLRLLLYDQSVFPEPLTGLPAFDAALPLVNEVMPHSELLRQYGMCFPGDLWNPPRGSSEILALVKLNPFHDGSMLNSIDIYSWINMSKHMMRGIFSPIQDLLKALNINEIKILRENVEGRILAGDQVIREYRSLTVSFGKAPDPWDCYKASKTIFVPLAPWELTAPLEVLLKESGGKPIDLVKEATKIYEKAVTLAGNNKDLRERAIKLGMWIKNTSTALIGNGPYYINKILSNDAGQIETIELTAFRHENMYWGSMGIIETFNSLFSWRLVNAEITRSPESGGTVKICFKVEGEDQLSTILLDSKVLPVDLALYRYTVSEKTRLNKEAGRTVENYAEIYIVRPWQNNWCSRVQIQPDSSEILVAAINKNVQSLRITIIPIVRDMPESSEASAPTQESIQTSFTDILRIGALAISISLIIAISILLARKYLTSSPP